MPSKNTKDELKIIPPVKHDIEDNILLILLKYLFLVVVNNLYLELITMEFKIIPFEQITVN